VPIAAHFEKTPTNKGKPRAARRTLLLETEGARAAGDAAAVLIHNVSASGLLIETQTELAADERIDIDLPLAGPTAARVVWSDGGFHGCQFEEHLPSQVLSAVQLRSAPSPSPAPQVSTEAFASRLRRLRKQKGLTLGALADRLGVSKPTVWAWEHGNARPVQDRIAALAEQLGVPQAEMLTGHDSDALTALLAKARRQIADAYGTEPAKVRIMIEL
jgi:transcriptional regulator with XRE-family HTH domain